MTFSIPDLVPAYNVLSAYLPKLAAGGGIRAGLSAALRAAYLANFQGTFCTSPEAPSWAQRIAAYARDEFRDNACRNGWLTSQLIPARQQGSGKGQRAVNFQYVQKINPNYLAGSQDYGNCRGWSARECTMILLGIDCAAGDLHRIEYRHGTALVYGSRGHSGEGMDMATGAKVLNNLGQCEERKYDFGLDLSSEKLDEDAGAAWGRSGPPEQLQDAVRGDQVEQVSSLSDATLEVVQDVLFSQGMVDTGSTLTSTDTGDPIGRLEKIGGHAQAMIGYDDTEEFREWYAKQTGKRLTEGVLIFDQSWGDWNKVSNWPEHLWGPRPQGAFVLKASDGMHLVRDWGDSYAYHRLRGFVPRALPDWGTWTYL